MFISIAVEQASQVSKHTTRDNFTPNSHQLDYSSLSDSRLGWIWTAAVEIKDYIQLLTQWTIRAPENSKQMSSFN